MAPLEEKPFLKLLKSIFLYGKSFLKLLKSISLHGKSFLKLLKSKFEVEKSFLKLLVPFPLRRMCAFSNCQFPQREINIFFTVKNQSKIFSTMMAALSMSAPMGGLILESFRRTIRSGGTDREATERFSRLRVRSDLKESPSPF